MFAGFFCGAAATGIVWLSAVSGSPAAPPPSASAPVIFSTEKQGIFPGLTLHGSDFLIPLNRLCLTQYVSADAPADSGRENKPFTVMAFQIQEQEHSHWFLLSGAQGETVSDFRYLGRDVVPVSFAPATNGYRVFSYRRNGDSRILRCPVAHSFLLGEEPAADKGCFEPLLSDRRARQTDPVNWERFRGLDLAGLLLRLQQAIRNNDRRAVADYFRYPVESTDRIYYTRNELVADYDRLFTPERKAALLNGSPKEIRPYRDLGFLLPGDLLCAAADRSEAAPIQQLH